MQLAALDACLVLLADHELAASTLAARVAASAWADPYRVVLAGLGPLGGALHGASPLAVESMLGSDRRGPRRPSPRWSGWSRRVARRPGSATASTATAIRAQTTCSRASARPRSTPVRLGRVAALVEAAAALGLPAPNVDLAVAGLGYAMGLAPGSASTIFTVARIAGLLAHAIEEYPHRLRFRPRATRRQEPPHAPNEPRSRSLSPLGSARSRERVGAATTGRPWRLTA